MPSADAAEFSLRNCAKRDAYLLFLDQKQVPRLDRDLLRMRDRRLRRQICARSVRISEALRITGIIEVVMQCFSIASTSVLRSYAVGQALIRTGDPSNLQDIEQNFGLQGIR